MYMNVAKTLNSFTAAPVAPALEEHGKLQKEKA
jgi:hypothetical protein